MGEKIDAECYLHPPTHPPTQTVLWNSFMALQVYRWILLKQDTRTLRAQLHPAILLIVTYAIANCAFWRLAVAPMNGKLILTSLISPFFPSARTSGTHTRTHRERKRERE